MISFNSIKIPEGIVNKIFSNDILIWESPSYTTIITPLLSTPGEMPITSISVKKRTKSNNNLLFN